MQMSANSADSDETAHYELSHQNLQCLQASVLICRGKCSNEYQAKKFLFKTEYLLNTDKFSIIFFLWDLKI